MMKKSIIILFFFISMIMLNAENKRIDNDYQNYGIFGNYNFLFNNAQFSRLPGVPSCCPQFNDGIGQGYSIGGVYEHIFSNYGIEAKIGLNLLEGDFISNEDIVISVNNEPFDAVFQHKISYKLRTFNFEVGFKYVFIDFLNVSIGIGSNYVFSNEYYQFEKIKSPSGKVYFLDSNGNSTNSDIRNERRGDLPNLNTFQTYIYGQVGYELPINKSKSLIIRPEISYRLGLNNVIKDIDWKMNVLKVGFSIFFTSSEIISVQSKGEIAQIQKLKEDSLKAAFDAAKAIEDEENKKLAEKIKVKEQELQKYKKEIEEKDKSLIALKDKDLEESKRIEQEKEAILKELEAANLKSANKCECYSVLYISTMDKKEADYIYNTLIKKGFKNIKINQFIEESINQKFYRVQSNCYKNPADAIDEMYIAFKSMSNSDIEPTIICD